MQAKFQKKQAETLSIRNEEVARAIDDVLHLVATYPRENASESALDESEMRLFKSYYSGLMYKVCGEGVWLGVTLSAADLAAGVHTRAIHRLMSEYLWFSTTPKYSHP